MKQRVYNSTFRDPGYPLFKPRDSGFSLFETRDPGLKVCTGGGMPKITRGITGLPEILGRDYGVEGRNWPHQAHNIKIYRFS